MSAKDLERIDGETYVGLALGFSCVIAWPYLQDVLDFFTPFTFGWAGSTFVLFMLSLLLINGALAALNIACVLFIKGTDFLLKINEQN